MNTHHRFERVANPKLIEADRIISIEETYSCFCADGITPATIVVIRNALGRNVVVCSGCPENTFNAKAMGIYETRIKPSDVLKVRSSRHCEENSTVVYIRISDEPGHHYMVCSGCDATIHHL